MTPMIPAPVRPQPGPGLPPARPGPRPGPGPGAPHRAPGPGDFVIMGLLALEPQQTHDHVDSQG